MFFSYTVSVMVLSFAMYGMWCLLHECWRWWIEPRFLTMPSCSLLVTVPDMDGDIEDLFRYLIWKIENSDIVCDVVVVDVSCDGFTTLLLEQLAKKSECLSLITPARPWALTEGLPLCRGKVIHVLDLSHRMNTEEFMVMICTLLGDRHELVVRRLVQ